MIKWLRMAVQTFYTYDCACSVCYGLCLFYIFSVRDKHKISSSLGIAARVFYGGFFIEKVILSKNWYINIQQVLMNKF